MVLTPESFPPLATAGPQARAFLFSFGAMVLLSSDPGPKGEIFRELARHAPAFTGVPGQNCHEEYDLLMEPGAPPTATNASATLPSLDHLFLPIIAFVLAQSVGNDQRSGGAVTPSAARGIIGRRPQRQPSATSRTSSRNLRPPISARPRS